MTLRGNLFIELQGIAFQFVAIVEAEGQYHFGSNKDEPGPTGRLKKMIKHSTSTRFLKTLGRTEYFTIAFSRLTSLKKGILRKSE